MWAGATPCRFLTPYRGSTCTEHVPLACRPTVRCYRLVFPFEGSEMAFFGTYLEVVPRSRLVWTNDESGDAGQITTVTFEEKDGKTLVTLHELYPSKGALDAALASGSQSGMVETFEQLDELIVALGASAPQS